MTTKKYLKRAIGIDSKIKMLQAEIDALTALPAYRSPADVRDRVMGGVRSDTTADPAIRTKEQCEDLEKRVAILVTERARYMMMFAVLEPLETVVMKYRYIDGLKLEEIGYKMHYAYGTVRQLAANALKNFEGQWSHVYKDL